MGGYVCAVDSEVCSVTGFLFSQLMGEHWSYTIFILHITLRQIFFCGVSELKDFIRFSSFFRETDNKTLQFVWFVILLTKEVDLHLFLRILYFYIHINRNPTFRTSRKTQKEFVKDTITCRLILLSLYIFCRPLFVWGWNTVKLNLLTLFSYFQLSFTNTLTFFFKCMLFLSQEDKDGEMHL